MGSCALGLSATVVLSASGLSSCATVPPSAPRIASDAVTPLAPSRATDETVPYVETILLEGSDLLSGERHPAEAVRSGSSEAGTRSSTRPRLVPTGDTGEASITFAPLLSRLPFRDLLVSWNIDAHAGASFRVELCVEEDGGAPSPWMLVGEWGSTPERDANVACDGGKVDVDCFRGERSFQRARVRVRAFGAPSRSATNTGGAPPAIEISRIALTFSDRTARVEDRAPTTAAALWKRRLDVPFRSQRTERPEIAGRICSPTSLTMVLAYRGVDRPVAEVASRAFDAPHDIYGNWPRNVQTAWTYGVPGYLTRIASWREVEARIAAGTPLIASIGVKPGQLAGAPYTKTDGHLIVITGFDEHGDVCVNDPAASDAAHGQLVYRRADLQTVWLDRGGTCYVLEAR